MLSRRIIRVKVMQALFTWQTTPELKPSDILTFYDQAVKSAYDLLAYHLYLLVTSTSHATEDDERRKAKLLPTELDKRFTPKIYTNSMTQAIARDKELRSQWERIDAASFTPEDFTKKLYKTFSLSESYLTYVQGPDSAEADREILLTFYKDLVKQEFFNDTVEDFYYNWLDDESIIIGTIKKILKALPEIELNERYGPSKETINDFGRNLLSYVLDNNMELIQIVEPLIQNWDIDRVATIDIIFIKMAIAEMIIFPSIPTKVTINEYVDLTKLYSTEKSKEFINGILDKVLQTLSEDKKIAKSGRGLHQ